MLSKAVHACLVFLRGVSMASRPQLCAGVWSSGQGAVRQPQRCSPHSQSVPGEGMMVKVLREK